LQRHINRASTFSLILLDDHSRDRPNRS